MTSYDPAFIEALLGILWPYIAVCLAALCLLLLVRLFANRRQQWAKRIIIGLVAALVYVLSFGPACWLCNYDCINPRAAWLAYRPVTLLSYHSPQPIWTAMLWWGDLMGKEYRESRQGQGVPEPFLIELRAQIPGVRFI